MVLIEGRSGPERLMSRKLVGVSATASWGAYEANPTVFQWGPVKEEIPAALK